MPLTLHLGLCVFSHEKVSRLFHELEARNTSIEKVEISVFHGTMASVVKKAAFQEQNELFTAELSRHFLKSFTVLRDEFT